MESQFDRGEIDRASLEATERLRQRLAQERSRARPSPGSGPGILPWLLAGSLLVFALGLLGNPWFEANVRGRLPFASAPPPPPASETEVLELAARLAALEARPEQSAPAPNERLARTEAKVETSTDMLAREVDRVDRLTSEFASLKAEVAADKARAEAAATNVSSAADRAEAMLAVMLARRAVNEGLPLGAAETPLRRAFEARYPGAVRAVLALGAVPVTSARLQRELADLGPISGEMTGGGASWWDVFSARISRLVRPAGVEPLPTRAAIDAALARGQIAEAAAQLRRLPPPRPAAIERWLAAANRLLAGEEALRQLETAALIPSPVVPLPPETPVVP